MKKRLCGLVLALALILSQAVTFNASAGTDPGIFPPLVVEPTGTDPGIFPPL